MDWGYEGSTRKRTCMLIVTHACNLNCSYCYEAHKQNAYTDVDLAKRIILQESHFVSESKSFEELEIDFMGGEPLMNFPLIKEMIYREQLNILRTIEHIKRHLFKRYCSHSFEQIVKAY